MTPASPEHATEVLNRVANNPAVRPWLGGEGEIDLTDLLEDEHNRAFVGATGGFIAHRLMPGIYEVHSIFEGAGAIQLARESLRYMFGATDCVRLVTKVPDGNLRAAGLCRMAGFQEEFRREAVWPSPDGMVGVSYQVLTFERWRASDPELPALGAEFHDWLEAEKLAAGSPLPTHPHDEAHDRAVGASFLMIKNGMAQKGVLTYNLWATFAGYASIELLADYPPVVDVRDAIVTLDGSTMRIVECR